MSIRINAIGGIGVYITDETADIVKPAHLWIEQRTSPIPGYPFPLELTNRIHTTRSVTQQANALRAQSSPTLRYTDDMGLTVDDYRIDVVRLAYPRRWLFPRGRSIGIATEDAHCLNSVRHDLRDDIIKDHFVRSYLETALWSSTMMSEDSEVSDLSYEWANFDPSDVSLETAIGAKRDCDAFRCANAADLEAAGYDAYNGHSFWLSRNGHGAGFFHRCDAIGTRLQDASRGFGEVNLYHVGDPNNDAVVYSDADVDPMGPFDLSVVWS